MVKQKNFVIEEDRFVEFTKNFIDLSKVFGQI